MKIQLESYAHVDESAKIQGVALIPRISRNHNLYTKEELRRFNNVKVPLNWEHDTSKIIGSVTFHYNESNETVYYEGEITDSSAAVLAKNKTLYTSIEATPTSVQQVCNGSQDCFHMPFGLKPEGLALVEMPGVPETSVIVEKYLAECNNPEMHKTMKRDEDGKLQYTNEDLIEQLDDIGLFDKLGICPDCDLKKKNK